MPEGGFFSFRTLISNTIIQTVYALGVVLITLAWLAMITLPLLFHFDQPPGSGAGPLGFEKATRVLVIKNQCQNIIALTVTARQLSRSRMP